jgi:hypothetical protein
MPAHRKRTERRRGQPDPVATRISSDLSPEGPDHDGSRDRTGTPATGRARYAVNDPHVDESAGGEFVQDKARPSEPDS